MCVKTALRPYYVLKTGSLIYMLVTRVASGFPAKGINESVC